MKGTPLNDELVDYMNDLYPAEDDFLRRLRERADAAGIPPIQISPEQGAFMQVLLKSIGAKRIIEIGTLAGYSAIMMGRALPEDGTLVTLEFEPKHAEFAREQIREAGLENKIAVKLGRAADILAGELADSGPYDFAFVDADKPGYVGYMNALIPMMRKGGMIAGDNALKDGRIIEADTEDATIRGMRAFNKAMAEDPRVQSCIVPIGDGICLGTVL